MRLAELSLKRSWGIPGVLAGTPHLITREFALGAAGQFWENLHHYLEKRDWGNEWDADDGAARGDRTLINWSDRILRLRAGIADGGSSNWRQTTSSAATNIDLQRGDWTGNGKMYRVNVIWGRSCTLRWTNLPSFNMHMEKFSFISWPEANQGAKAEWLGG